jgi:hypothetical protein
MRENAPPARPTLADRQVPASSSTEHGHLSSFFQSPEGAAAEGGVAPVETIALDNGLVPSCVEVAKAAFEVFKIAGNGEPILVEGDPTLDTAVARVVGLRACFPGEYMIVSQATGRRVLFAKQGVIKRS